MALMGSVLFGGAMGYRAGANPYVRGCLLTPPHSPGVPLLCRLSLQTCHGDRVHRAVDRGQEQREVVGVCRSSALSFSQMLNPGSVHLAGTKLLVGS